MRFVTKFVVALEKLDKKTLTKLHPGARRQTAVDATTVLESLYSNKQILLHFYVLLLPRTLLNS